MSYSSEVLADSPLAYYRLGEASGTTMVDSSGNGRDGTYGAGATLGATSLLASDATNKAIDCNGVLPGTVASASWMDLTSAYSVEFLFNADSVGSTPLLFGRWDGSASGCMFIVRLDSARVTFYRGVGGGYESIAAPTSQSATTTYHVVATFSAGAVKLYVNGTEVASASHSATQNTPAVPLALGAKSGGGDSFDGRLDEVAFYGTALSSGRVSAHYAAVTSSATTVNGTQATEADTAQAGSVVSSSIVVTGTKATETDAALTGSAIAPVFVVGGRAQESDSAQAGSAAIPPAVVVVGGTAQELSSGGYGSVRIMPPVMPAPIIAAAHSMIVGRAFGAVTMQGSQAVYAVASAAIPRARQRIVVDGVDVTYFRGAITPNVTYTLLEPLLYGPATLDLPQVSACFERPGVGALSWLRPGAEVTVQRVIDDVVVGTDYEGVIVAFDTNGRNLSVEIGGEASGRAALRNRQVPIFPRVNDLGRQFADSITDLGLSFNPHYGPTTGIEAMTTGGTGHLEHIQNLVAKAWTRAGKHWTIMPDEATGAYEAHRKDDETIHGTVFLDDAKTVANLRRDISEEHNRIYPTGVTPAGQRVRFGVYPGLIQGPTPTFPGHVELGDSGDGVRLLIGKLHAMGYLKLIETGGGYDQDVVDAVTDLQIDAGLFDEGFVGTAVPGEVNAVTWDALYDLGVTDNSLEHAHIEPAAQRRKVRPWNRAGTGGIMGVNPLYDPNHLVRDRNVDMGVGLTRSQMREFARTALHDSDDANWVGDITFHTGALIRGDGFEGMTMTEGDVMDARELRPGMNLDLPQFDGGTLVHIAAIQVDDSGIVTTTVDTRFRDAMEVWEVIARNKESRNDPGRQRNQKHRSSTIVKDSIGEWDEFAGFLGQDIDLEPGWNVFQVVAAMEGTVSRLRIELETPAEFVCAVFGRSINADRLETLESAPLSPDGKKVWRRKVSRDVLKERWILYSAGTDEEPCGYGQDLKSDDAELTGVHDDDAGFAYRSANRTELHIAVWVEEANKIPLGRVMWNQLEAGV